MAALVYLDTETTGLDWQRHDVVEVAWAVDDGPIREARPWHSLDNADPQALTINRYFERGLSSRVGGRRLTEIERELLGVLAGATIVGSNPAFDAAMLRRKYGLAHWHHRLLDVAAYGAGVLGMLTVPGLATIADVLRGRGYDIAQPDHTAGGDVLSLRQVHHALQDEVQNR